MRRVFILFLLFAAGCQMFSDKRRRVIGPPKVDMTSPRYQEMLSLIINKRYNNEILKCMLAEKAYQEYLLSLTEEPDGI